MARFNVLHYTSKLLQLCSYRWPCIVLKATKYLSMVGLLFIIYLATGHWFLVMPSYYTEVTSRVANGFLWNLVQLVCIRWGGKEKRRGVTKKGVGRRKKSCTVGKISCMEISNCEKIVHFINPGYFNKSYFFSTWKPLYYFFLKVW